MEKEWYKNVKVGDYLIWKCGDGAYLLGNKPYKIKSINIVDDGCYFGFEKLESEDMVKNWWYNNFRPATSEELSKLLNNDSNDHINDSVENNVIDEGNLIKITTEPKFERRTKKQLAAHITSLEENLAVLRKQLEESKVVNSTNQSDIVGITEQFYKDLTAEIKDVVKAGMEEYNKELFDKLDKLLDANIDKREKNKLVSQNEKLKGTLYIYDDWFNRLYSLFFGAYKW